MDNKWELPLLLRADLRADNCQFLATLGLLVLP